MRSIRPDQIQTLVQALPERLKKGLGTPEDLLPIWPSSRMPPKKDVLIADMLFALLKVFAYQAELATELVGTRDDVQACVRIFREGRRENSTLPLLQGWRWDLAGRNLWSVMESTPVTIVCDDIRAASENSTVKGIRICLNNILAAPANLWSFVAKIIHPRGPEIDEVKPCLCYHDFVIPSQVIFHYELYKRPEL